MVTVAAGSPAAVAWTTMGERPVLLPAVPAITFDVPPLPASVVTAWSNARAAALPLLTSVDWMNAPWSPSYDVTPRGTS